MSFESSIFSKILRCWLVFLVPFQGLGWARCFLRWTILFWFAHWTGQIQKFERKMPVNRIMMRFCGIMSWPIAILTMLVFTVWLLRMTVAGCIVALSMQGSFLTGSPPHSLADGSLKCLCFAAECGLSLHHLQLCDSQEEAGALDTSWLPPMPAGGAAPRDQRHSSLKFLVFSSAFFPLVAQAWFSHLVMIFVILKHCSMQG